MRKLAIQDLTSFSLVALATPLGAILSLTFIKGLLEATVGLLLAMAGGSFLYIGASGLILETHEKGELQMCSFCLWESCAYSFCQK